MANLAAIQVSADTLRYGDSRVPLRTATSFWADYGNRQINLYCHTRVDQESFQSTFRIPFETLETMRSAIASLIERTNIKPSIFFVRNLKVLNGNDDSPPQINFQLMNREQALHFVNFCSPLLPDYFFSMKELPDSGGNYEVNLKLADIELRDTVEKVQEVFHKIMEKFGSTGIESALEALNDTRFPAPERVPGAVCDPEYSLDHVRTFDVTFGGIYQVIELLDSVKQAKNVTEEEIERWIQDPVSFRGLQKEEKNRKIAALLREEMMRPAVDGLRELPLMTEALRTPGFDMVAFLKTLNIQ